MLKLFQVLVQNPPRTGKYHRSCAPRLLRWVGCPPHLRPQLRFRCTPEASRRAHSTRLFTPRKIKLYIRHLRRTLCTRGSRCHSRVTRSAAFSNRRSILSVNCVELRVLPNPLICTEKSVRQRDSLVTSALTHPARTSYPMIGEHLQPWI